MYLRHTYEIEFDELWMHLKSKYPQRLFDLEGIGKQTDMSEFSKKFFSTTTTTADISVDSNANVCDMSVIAYENELLKPNLRFNSYYMMWKYVRQLFGTAEANKAIEMQLVSDIYINDFHGYATGKAYCFNYSTYDVLINGLPFVDKIDSKPPKHFLAFKSQLDQFVTYAANSTLGATGLADLLIVSSYYVNNMLSTLSDSHFSFKSKDDVWEYVKQNLVSFIYTINQPMRGNQSPFSNISVYDNYFLSQLCNDYVFPDGSKPNVIIIEKLQQIFIEIMNEELRRTPITFPVTTACFAVDEERNILDKTFLKYIAEQNQEFGFINIYAGSSSTLSSCCRLRSDTLKISEYFNSFGSGSTKIGSLSVCTVNMPRIAIKAEKNKEKFFEILQDTLQIVFKINHARRHVIKKRIENGNLPLYSMGFMSINRQYSTIGVTGIYEMCLFMGYDILTDSGTNFVIEVLNYINNYNEQITSKHKYPTNMEQIPAENTGIKLAEKDKLLGFQNEFDIYSNQFIPLIVNTNMLNRIKLQGIFDKHMSGGSILHVNVEEKIEDTQQLIDLIEGIVKTGTIYFAINYNIQRCENGHMSVGREEFCSVCGEKIVDNFTRVVGFLTNSKNWSKTRREKDYPNRQWY
ncbi:MAG: anaerobic ribonucleoside-triphosphate reductase [Caldisericia bacterium]|nr:anaerobic ribonucleoside-triphosphate reductase [Caldisericia bacterium]